MIEHIGNCHNEWGFLLGGIPAFALWLKHLLLKRHMRKHNECSHGKAD